MNIINCFAELLAYTVYFKNKIASTQPEYERISTKFNQLITASRNLVKDDDSEFYMWERGFFAVCAWIDEQILLSEWQKKEVWQLNPLQKQYFRTAHAGEKFFEVLDGLLPEKDAQIIEVYHFCIKLGFQGKNFKPQKKGMVIESRNNTDSQTDTYFEVGIRTLFPQAYRKAGEHTKVRERLRINLRLILILVSLTSVFCLIVLSAFYSMLLNDQISGYYL